ncbi:urea ABC transporter permease subunit UrtB [Pokkaliibacter plantistimulans]
MNRSNPVRYWLTGLLALMLWSMTTLARASESDTQANEFDTLASQLAAASFKQKGELVEQLAQTQDPRAAALLSAFLEGELYSSKDNPAQLLIRQGTTYSDALSGSVVATANGKKLIVNNALRGQLRDLLAFMSLLSKDAGERLQAAQRLLSTGSTAEQLPRLQKAFAAETDEQVRAVLGDVIAVAELGSPDKALRLLAVDTLRGSLSPEVRARLDGVAQQDSDAEVRQAAASALTSIQSKIDFNLLLQNIFFGLSLGSVLLLAAVGLAITFGVMGVINMAHGELIMIGAYTTWVVQQLMPNHIGISILVAIPAAFVVSGLVGIAIERCVIRFLYGRPLETLLATFGISLILQQAVRSLFSPLNRAVTTPDWMSGSWQINPILSLTYNRLYILIFALIVFFALMLVLKRTSLGLKVRAVSQNRAMARAVGVRANRVDALTFGLGAGIAGVAGVALSQLTNVGPNLGQAYIIDSFMVVVFGGVGNLWGTLVGAMGLGVVNKFLEPYSGAVLAKILALVFIILFIQKRPRGLFPQKGRAAEA